LTEQPRRVTIKKNMNLCIQKQKAAASLLLTAAAASHHQQQQQHHDDLFECVTDEQRAEAAKLQKLVEEKAESMQRQFDDIAMNHNWNRWTCAYVFLHPDTKDGIYCWSMMSDKMIPSRGAAVERMAKIGFDFQNSPHYLFMNQRREK
jgi:hypothetical protein